MIARLPEESEMREMAKDLFLTPDEFGGHRYTYEEIVSKVRLKFPDMAGMLDVGELEVWANERPVAGVPTWVELKLLSFKLVVTSKSEDPNKSWTEIIRDNMYKFESQSVGELWTLKRRALEYIQTNNFAFADMNEAVSALMAANSGLNAVMLPMHNVGDAFNPRRKKSR